MAKLQQRFPDCESVLLSTCNRVELYTAAASDAASPNREDVADFLAEFHGLDKGETCERLLERTGRHAVKHLFMVASSLDSMVVGEPQILAQVKQAYELAKDGAHARELTHAAFQAAMHAAKRVATETTIHRKRVSIPSVAVADFARADFRAV